MVNDKFDQLEIFLLGFLLFRGHFLRELRQSVLRFEEKVVCIVRRINCGDGVQNHRGEVVGFGLQEGRVKDLKRRDIPHRGAWKTSLIELVGIQ